MKGRPGQVVACCFALCAFAISIISGMAAGNDAFTVLGRAIIALMVCYVIGSVIGSLCERTVNAHINAEDAILAAERLAAEPKMINVDDVVEPAPELVPEESIAA